MPDMGRRSDNRGCWEGDVYGALRGEEGESSGRGGSSSEGTSTSTQSSVLISIPDKTWQDA